MRARAFALLGCLFLSASCATEPGQRFFAQLDGVNEVPPNTVTGASGRANFTARPGELDYDLSVQNIVDVVAAHIHAGAGGVNGPVVATLYSSAAPSGPITAQTLSTGTLRPSDLTGMSLDSLLVLMRTGAAYVNVHTVTNSAGEIRGQIGPS